MSAESLATWVCPDCTLINPLAAAACEACGCAAPIDPHSEAGVQPDVADVAETRGRASSAQSYTAPTTDVALDIVVGDGYGAGARDAVPVDVAQEPMPPLATLRPERQRCEAYAFVDGFQSGWLEKIGEVLVNISEKGLCSCTRTFDKCMKREMVAMCCALPYGVVMFAISCVLTAIQIPFTTAASVLLNIAADIGYFPLHMYILLSGVVLSPRMGPRIKIISVALLPFFVLLVLLIHILVAIIATPFITLGLTIGHVFGVGDVPLDTVPCMSLGRLLKEQFLYHSGVLLVSSRDAARNLRSGLLPGEQPWDLTFHGFFMNPIIGIFGGIFAMVYGLVLAVVAAPFCLVTTTYLYLKYTLHCTLWLCVLLPVFLVGLVLAGPLFVVGILIGLPARGAILGFESSLGTDSSYTLVRRVNDAWNHYCEQLAKMTKFVYEWSTASSSSFHYR